MRSDVKSLFEMIKKMALDDREKALGMLSWIDERVKEDPDLLLLQPKIIPDLIKALQGSTDQLIKLLTVLQRDELSSEKTESSSDQKVMLKEIQAEIERVRSNVVESALGRSTL